jgi:hypothetical protein
MALDNKRRAIYLLFYLVCFLLVWMSRTYIKESLNELRERIAVLESDNRLTEIQAVQAELAESQAVVVAAYAEARNVRDIKLRLQEIITLARVEYPAKQLTVIEQLGKIQAALVAIAEE